MNKAIINDEIVIAYDVLKKSEIVENGKIKENMERTDIDIWCGCDHG